MTKIVYYSLAGGLATIIALSLIKRKPTRPDIMTAQRALPSPKAYKTAANDSLFIVAKRFGTTTAAMAQVNGTNLPGLNNKMKVPGTIINLPPNVSDLGSQSLATGVTL